VFAERARLATKAFKVRKDLLFDVAERLLCRKLAPVRPTQLAVWEERVKLLATEASSALCILFPFIELL